MKRFLLGKDGHVFFWDDGSWSNEVKGMEPWRAWSRGQSNVCRPTMPGPSLSHGGRTQVFTSPRNKARGKGGTQVRQKQGNLSPKKKEEWFQKNRPIRDLNWRPNFWKSSPTARPDRRHRLPQGSTAQQNHIFSFPLSPPQSSNGSFPRTRCGFVASVIIDILTSVQLNARPQAEGKTVHDDFMTTWQSWRRQAQHPRKTVERCWLTGPNRFNVSITCWCLCLGASITWTQTNSCSKDERIALLRFLLLPPLL